MMRIGVVMNMRRRDHLITVALLALLTAMAAPSALAAGGDYPNKTKFAYDHWPEGMSAVVNVPERIHGYWVNAEETFFFKGSQKLFDELLLKYSKIEGVVEHKVVVQEGTGRTRSPWQKGEGLPCDWMIYGCPASWAWVASGAEGEIPDGYILEIHIWKEGLIKIDENGLPKKVKLEVIKAEQPAETSESKPEVHQNPATESKGR